jgi:hypothetical protein
MTPKQVWVAAAVVAANLLALLLDPDGYCEQLRKDCDH